jgi:hypothetical protein
MQKKHFIPLAIVGLISLSAWIYDYFSPKNAPVTAAPVYKTLKNSAAFQGARIPFDDVKCLGPMPDGKIEAAYFVGERKYTSPKGVPVREVLVAVQFSDPSGIYYSLEILGYRKGRCLHFASGQVPEDPRSLSQVFGPARAREIQLTWDKWRLKYIPNWHKTQQDYLDRSSPIPMLTDEDVWSLKQLGYKLPKKWKKIS